MKGVEGFDNTARAILDTGLINYPPDLYSRKKAQTMERLYNISENWKKYAVEVISLLFILLFAYTASNQLLEIDTFHAQLTESPFLGPYAGYLLWMVPVPEILLSFLFCFDKWRFLALCLSFFLMIIFTLYIVAVLNFTESIPCSCGGAIPSITWREHLIFNIGFIFLASLGIAISPKKNSPKI